MKRIKLEEDNEMPETPLVPDPDVKRVKLESHAVVLDPKQQHILDLCLTGKNVYLSGLAGTGKTYLLRHIADRLRIKFGAKRVAVVSPTGISSIIVGGQTIHSMAGCAVPSVVSDFEKCFTRKERWLEIAVLIIDEASMIEPSYLDWVDSTVRQIRRVPDKAMGSIQIICSADFLQLPGICKGVSLRSKCPVKYSPSTKKIPASVSDFQAYAFQTMFWRDSKFVNAELTTVFRQSEIGMVNALAKIRKGCIDDEVRCFIASCIRELPMDAEIKPTVLYARNRDVDFENETNLNALPGTSEVYLAKDSVQVDAGAPTWAKQAMLKDGFFKSALVPDRVVLKVGAQVMLTKNFDTALVNGSMGVVKRFATKEKSIESITTRISICTDDAARASLVAQLETVRSGPATLEYPLVLFCNGRTLLCCPVEFEHSLYLLGKLKRVQVPLKLGYAVSMHKSQGQSIDRVKVDLTGSFCEGQVYVALSRAKTIAGLQITGFSEGLVRANPLAVEFHNALSSGTLDEFLKTVPLWFAPLFKSGIDPNWRALFESSAVFRGWVERM